MAFSMVVNTACYSFVPAPQGVTQKIGGEVKVRLNAEGTTELARVLGPRVEYAEGTLTSVEADGSVVVGVTSVRLLDGIDQVWSGRSVVTFAPKHVVEVQVRALDKKKTRVASIAAIVGLVTVFALAISGGGAHGTSDPGAAPPPP
jgi:hypothetical protein